MHFEQSYNAVYMLVSTSIGEMALDKHAKDALFNVMVVLLKAALLDRADAEIQAASAAIAFKERVLSNAEDKFAVVVRLCKRIHDVALAYDETSHSDWLTLYRLTQTNKKDFVGLMILQHTMAVHPSVSLDRQPSVRMMLECIVRISKFESQLEKLNIEITDIPRRLKDFALVSLKSILPLGHNSRQCFERIEREMKARFFGDRRFTIVTTELAWKSLQDAWEIVGIESSVISVNAV